MNFSLAVFFSLLLCAQASAKVLREDIGELNIHDLLLRPEFKLQEPSEGAFSIGESSFALRWELEKRFGGVIRIGPRTLLNPLARYQPLVDEDVVIVEGFAEYTDLYGRFRMGRIPVEFGYEGRLWERELLFPRSLIFSKRAVMLRDLGVSYEISQNGFFTGFVVHNGESDSDTDGRIWYTARWGLRGENFELGMTGQTGGTKPIATSASTDTLAGVDPLREAKWRQGGMHFVYNKKKWEWVLEVYAGEREQMQEVGKYSAGHTDLGHRFTKNFSAYLRYDQMDPNSKIPNDLERRASIGFIASNKTHSSNVILVGTKVIEQGTQVNNDELRLIWSLSPSGVVRF